MKLVKLHEEQLAVYAVCGNQGKAPLLDFLVNLSANLKASRDRMLRLLERCAEEGPPENRIHKHYLGEGIFELRSGRLRVLFFTDTNNGTNKLIICSHGLIKKGRKIPKRDIKIAQRARSRYLDAKREQRLQIQEDENHAQ